MNPEGVTQFKSFSGIAMTLKGTYECTMLIS